MANKKGSHQLTRADRLKMEVLLNVGVGASEIARQLQVHRSTIYNEKKRGQYIHRNSDWTEEVRYSSDLAQRRCDENMKVRGKQLKIGKDMDYAKYLEKKILKDNYSPAAVLGELKAQGREKEFKTRVCVTTLYNYIDKGVFLELTNKHLPVKRKKKRKYNKVEKVQSRANAGDSIERRPKRIEKRKEFGHWEMDFVVGQRGKSKFPLLVLTERKTRAEIIRKLSDYKAASVVDSLDQLEKKWGEKFSKLFKTITVDNGSEFSACEDMERSILLDGKRTKLYYCHPYSSWERGTNEVTNKMIRRKIPKGTNFDSMTAEEIQEIEDWINNYPRRIHGYKSARELFEKEVLKLA